MAVSIALATAVAPARAEVAAAPFDGNLQRLAEILGALHYLRNICGANEGLKWRNEMQSLVDAETPGALLALNDFPFVRFSITLATSRDVRFASCTRGDDTVGYE